MTWTDLLPPLPSLKMDSIQQEGRQMLITLVSTRESDQCPTCQTNSQAVTHLLHSLGAVAGGQPIER
jgi:hypothetical protein